MKNLTIKSKLMLTTMGFLILLLSLLLLLFGIIFNISADRSTQDMIKRIVHHNIDEISMDNNEITISSNYTFLKNDVYCAVISEKGSLIEGILPLHDLLEYPLTHGEIRHIKTNGNWYYIYDIQLSIAEDLTIWLRGTTAAAENHISVSSIAYITLFSIPIYIILSAAAAHFIISHSLKPIKRINQTAVEITKSGDLTKRIENNSKDELGQLADTFNQMFDQLEFNFEAERQFTADASHELRNPLSVILAQCEYALEHADNEIELYECIGAIQKQGHQISNMLEALLKFTRLEQNAISFNPKKTDLSSLTKEICDEYINTHENNISLTYQIDDHIILTFDENLFSILLHNLIRNAYRYGKKNGTIHVSLSLGVQSVILAVKDNGIGISKEDLPKIWNRFYRADKARSFENNGIGLGLPIVKKIVTLHHGTIEVESSLNQGTTFVITFQK